MATQKAGNGDHTAVDGGAEGSTRKPAGQLSPRKGQGAHVDSPRSTRVAPGNRDASVAQRNMVEDEVSRRHALPSINMSHNRPKARPLVHVESMKELLHKVFKTVCDAFVFFDHMKVNFVSTMNLKRGLVKLSQSQRPNEPQEKGIKQHAEELVSNFDELVKEFEWKCADVGKVLMHEFVHLLQWHPVENMEKEMMDARLSFDQLEKHEQNKSIRIKVNAPHKPRPVCAKLREILKSKYSSVAVFMVKANMDVESVISFSELELAFRLEKIEGIDIERLADELSDPAFPPTAIKTQSFAQVLRWHKIEEVEAQLPEERLAYFKARNAMEKGLPRLKLHEKSLPFFKERPELDKAVSLMKKLFSNAADAFVFFDTDNSGEITRVKMSHGLKRMIELDDQARVLIEQQIEENQAKMEDLQEQILQPEATKWTPEELRDKEAEVKRLRTKLQELQKAATPVIIDSKKLLKEMSGLTFTGGCIDAEGFISNFRWHDKFDDIRETVRNARLQRDKKAAVIPSQKMRPAEQQIVATKKVMFRGLRKRVKPGILGGNVPMDEWLRSKELKKTLDTLSRIRVSPEHYVAAVTEEASNCPTQADDADTFNVDGPRPEGASDTLQKPNVYEKQLNTGRRWKHSRKASKLARPVPRHPPKTAKEVFKSVLQDKGFGNSIDAFTFFDVDRKGSITRGDLQKGLLMLRIFKITAKMVPFPRMGSDGIDRMDLLQFLVLYAWDDSLDQILAMEGPDIVARLQGSYSRRDEIQASALEEAQHRTERNNAELKALVLRGLTDLPDMYSLPSKSCGNQTDRSHVRFSKGSKVVGSTKNGSQTARGRTMTDKKKTEGRKKPEQALNPAEAKHDSVHGVDVILDAHRRADKKGTVGVGARLSQAHTNSSQQHTDDTMSHARAIAARHPSIAAGGKHALKGHHVEGVPLDSKAKTGFGSSASAHTLPWEAAADTLAPAVVADVSQKSRASHVNSLQKLKDDSVSNASAEEQRQPLIAATVQSDESEAGQEAGDIAEDIERDEGVDKEKRPHAGDDIKADTRSDGSIKSAKIMMHIDTQVRPSAETENGFVHRQGDGSHLRERADGIETQFHEDAVDPHQGDDKEAENEYEDDWEVLDEELEMEASKNPHSVLLAEKFMADKIIRIEDKYFTYEGQVNDEGRPHGQGIKFFPVHAPAQADVVANLQGRWTGGVGRKLEHLPMQDESIALQEHWQVGKFSNGKMTGSGMMRTADGSYYFGDFKEGKRHGAGMSLSGSGVTYEGEFFNDLKDGCGCLWTETGPAYFGEWQLDKRHGSGVSGSSNPSLIQHVDTEKAVGLCVCLHERICARLRLNTLLFLS